MYNSDQSDFQLELHAGRTLAEKDVKKVKSVAQSTSIITHSYTIQPIISAGRLLSPLLIVLKESSETLGRVQKTIIGCLPTRLHGETLCYTIEHSAWVPDETLIFKLVTR